MKQFLITEQQLQLFLDYLSQRPHKEVEAGIVMLKNLPEHEGKGEVKAPPVKKKK